MAISDAVSQTGLHVVIYGERGVGKSSLANVIGTTIIVVDKDQLESRTSERLIVKVNAESGDTFSQIWNRLFTEVNWTRTKTSLGLVGTSSTERLGVHELFGIGETLDNDAVRRVLKELPGSVFIIDEFDRAAVKNSGRFTDLIKSLSDYGIDSTIVLVGVSSTIDQLIKDHASISRALTQIHLPRMMPAALMEILNNAAKQISIEFEEKAAQMIVHVSQGLPHYTHLIGLNAVRAAAKDLASLVEMHHVIAGMKEATKQAQQTVSKSYQTATHSSHHDALYKEVLLACAVTATRSTATSGFFVPRDVVEPLKLVLGRDISIANFNNHLSEFSQERRSTVLTREGQERSYRFRFSDPLLVPYVFMEAVSRGQMTEEGLVNVIAMPEM